MEIETSNVYDGEKAPIKWINIIDKNKEIIFCVPYTDEIKIKDYKEAMFKSICPIFRPADLLKIIEYTYDLPSIICPSYSKYKGQTVKIIIKKPENYTQLYFINKFLREIYGGILEESEKGQVAYNIKFY